MVIGSEMPSQTLDEDLVIDEAPSSIDPYATLGLEKEATSEQIKSAYRKAALKHHPDKAAASDKDAAHTKFQQIAFAYAILSDERRRRRFDATGRTEESLDLEDDDFDWTTFYREQFKDIVTEEAINKFAQGYKGSDEERDHVIAAYEKFGGNMDKIHESVMLSDVVDDDERFRGIIDLAIRNGEVEGYPKYTEESEKSIKSRISRAKKRKEKEARAAEKAVEELQEKKDKRSKKKDDTSDLMALIQEHCRRAEFITLSGRVREDSNTCSV